MPGCLHKERCIHRKQNGGILSWCSLKENYCPVEKDVYCIDLIYKGGFINEP